jgi:(p)ppGpp synthase/HD superfamily hydrolase
MFMSDIEQLNNLVLAPYIIKATALIGKQRHVGGNAFRHNMAAMSILLDYKLFSDHVLLKAAVIHDLLEDIPETDEFELRQIDSQGNLVVDLVLEVTRPKGMEKSLYLKNILTNGSRNAKILKVVDRIDNLKDLNVGHFSKQKMINMINETEQYVLPMAREVNLDMEKELKDLIDKKREQIAE